MFSETSVDTQWTTQRYIPEVVPLCRNVYTTRSTAMSEKLPKQQGDTGTRGYVTRDPVQMTHQSQYLPLLYSVFSSEF
jgi:hypothetical protein